MMQLRRALFLIQKFAGIATAGIALLLLADSLLLYITTLPDASVLVLVRLHVWLGGLLCITLPAFFAAHLTLHQKHPNRRARFIGYGLVGMLIAGCTLGVTIFVVGKSSTTIPLVIAHEIMFVAGLIGYIAHRLAARATPAFKLEIVGGALVTVLLCGFWIVSARLGSPATDDDANAVADFGMTRARTVDGHFLKEDDLANPAYCAQCHTEIAEQWDASAHHFSSFNNPFYSATFNDVRQHRPASAMRFCGGCHDPLLVHTGNMETLPITEKTPNAHAGISCLACHAIESVPDRVGNAGYVIAAPQHYPDYNHPDAEPRDRSNKLIFSKPQQHKASFMKPFMRTSEFCLACHKAHLPAELNEYRWKRGPNDFDAWQISSASGEAALTFYNQAKPQNCQSCHMPDVETNDPAAKDGKTREHSFASANTALAAVHDKQDWIRKAQALLKDCATIDVFAAVVEAEPGSQSTQRVVPLDDPAVRVPAGALVRAEVMVTNNKVAHQFPGGTLDLHNTWIEFVVRDEDDQIIVASGLRDEGGHVEPSAHRLHNILLMKDGTLIDIHNVEFMFTELYNNVLLLNASDVIRYQFHLPTSVEAGHTLYIHARLLHRKFPRRYIEFALGEGAPPMPLTVISEHAFDLKISGGLAAAQPTPSPMLTRRMNNFGIAHLRQGDTRTARWAFEHVAEMVDGDPDVYINLARAHLLQGRHELIEAELRKAEAIRPGYHKTAYFLGRLRAIQGRFDEAIAAYDVTLDVYPRDRDVLNDKGQAQFKAQQYEAAIETLNRTLAVDPENVDAHTLLWRSYSSLGQADMAEMHQIEKDRFRPEFTEARAARQHRAKHPEADLESNAEHIHLLDPYKPVKRWSDMKRELHAAGRAM